MWTPTHVQVTVQRARGLLIKGKNKTNDCFVTIALGKEKYQTSVKEKASNNVEWHEECELQIPQQGNTAEIVLTALHRNFLGVDEFLGTVNIPLSTLEVYDRPKNRWYTLNSKPGKENTKERGELEVKIGFIVKAGSLTDLTKRERHKSSLGQLSNAAHSIGGSLLSIGSIEKRKSLKKLAKSIGSRVKGRSKGKLNEDDLDEKDEHYFRPTNQEPGEADPGVISEDDDEFTFDVLSHKSSASSLNAPVVAANSNQNNSPSNKTFNSNIVSERSTPPPANVAPSKPPRFTMSSLNTPKVENLPLEADEWGRKLYGKQANNVLKRWENKSKTLNDDLRNEKDTSPSPRLSPVFKYKDIPEPLSPAPREIITKPNKDEKSLRDKIIKEERMPERNLKEEKHSKWSPREDKTNKKDKKRERDNNKNKEAYHDGHINSERIIIGGEDGMKNNGDMKGRLPHEVVAQFEGRSREDLIELIWQLQDDVAQKKKRLHDLEDYIDSLLLRVIESSPRLLQNPYQSQRRLSSPGHQ